MKSRHVLSVLLPVGVVVVIAVCAAAQQDDQLKPRRVQDRAVPLAKLPPEIYQPSRPAAVTRLPATTTTTRRAVVPDPFASARTRLAKDPALREWFDQWQVDVAAERETSAARVTQLRTLLQKTPLTAQDLSAVAAAVAAVEGESSGVARAWSVAAAAKGR